MEDLKKRELEKKIELAAFRHWSDGVDMETGRSHGSESSFITGVESPEAKEYWQQKLGEELSEIINQDGDEVSDGECIDQIIKYLLKNDIYVDRR